MAGIPCVEAYQFVASHSRVWANGRSQESTDDIRGVTGLPRDVVSSKLSTCSRHKIYKETDQQRRSAIAGSSSYEK